MLRDKLFIYIIAIIMIFIISFWVAISEREQTQISEAELTEQNTEHFKNVEIVLYDNEQTSKATLSSKDITRITEDGVIKMSPITINFYDIMNDDKLLYSLTATQGRYLSEDNYLKMDGSLEFIKDNIKLTLGSLHWFQDNNKIKGENGFKLATTDFIIKGANFKSDLFLERITVFGDETEQAHFKWGGKEDVK